MTRRHQVEMNTERVRYPWPELEVGDSFQIHRNRYPGYTTFRQALHNARKRHAPKEFVYSRNKTNTVITVVRTS